MIYFEEMDEHTQEALLNVARAFNKSVQVVIEKWNETMQAVSEAIAPAVKQIGMRLQKLPDLPRTPTEIKKEIKHEKNPMRLKQLNKELNESYKVYKRK